jgi:hypothetical protein
LLGNSLPYTWWFYQIPHSGYGFIVLTLLNVPSFTPPNSLVRSVARTRLKSKLISGKKYCSKVGALARGASHVQSLGNCRFAH